MCGIAGIMRFTDGDVDAGRVRAMLTHLRHRGPDGEGVAEYERCALIHTRLSIIDLLSGTQPMKIPAAPGSGQRTSEGRGELCLVFNGEIYNHRALRALLEARGHRFTSDHSDTEVLLYGYREWGTELPKHLHGMFAFAIWDAVRGALFLARDRVGKKPLYFRRSASEISFASLIATLVQGAPRDERPTINGYAMLRLLRLGYTGRRSLLNGIEEVPAAHWMLVEADGGIRQQRYWQPPPISRTSTSLGAVSATREVIAESVAERLEADVSLGCFLSGGIDSSVVAALAQQELNKRGGDALQTFSVAIPSFGYDESPHARAVAKHIGSNHRELTAQPGGDIIDDLRTLIALSGEPTADSSILPTYWLSQTTRQHVKAVLSGDGGDELFAGYDRYRAMRICQRHGWWLGAMPSFLLRSAEPRSMRTRMRRLIEAARRRDPAQRYQRMMQLFDEDAIRSLGYAFPDDADLGDARMPDWPDETDPVHAAMRWDLLNYLPHDLLRKVDRASMAVSLEVRCPLLGTAVCDLAGHLPHAVLMPGGRAKHLLRRVGADLLPRSIVQRPKRGFAIPIGQWFRDNLRRPLVEQLRCGALASLGFNEQTIGQLASDHFDGSADHGHRLFALLMLSLWAQWLTTSTAAA